MTLTASIGAVLADATSTAHSLLQHADSAMYNAKRAGKEQISVQSATDQDPAAADEQPPGNESR